jgi:hypothetical protein
MRADSSSMQFLCFVLNDATCFRVHQGSTLTPGSRPLLYKDIHTLLGQDYAVVESSFSFFILGYHASRFYYLSTSYEEHHTKEEIQTEIFFHCRPSEEPWWGRLQEVETKRDVIASLGTLRT